VAHREPGPEREGFFAGNAKWLVALLAFGFLAAQVLGGGRADRRKQRRRMAPPPPLDSAAVAARKRPPFEVREVTFPSDGRELFAKVWKPYGPGPFPAFVYNHGSEKDVRLDDLAPFFVHRGYVFFLPHRRGHGKSPGTHYAERIKGESPADRALVQELERQAADVGAALSFLKTQPYVTAAKIAMGGCSFGGTQTLLAAEREGGLRAAIDWAGATKTWEKNEPLRERLKEAVRSARVPIYFLQAQNDFSTEPTLALSKEAGKQPGGHEAKIYPPYGATADDGHGAFCRASSVWGADVIDFLERKLGP
jgi:carboxymethylenebutenolidase